MICMSDLEQQAIAILPTIYSDYFAGGAGRESTLRANLRSFEDLQLWPRVLRGRFEDSLGTRLLGSQLDWPILAAPTAFHKLASPLGELATAKAVASSKSLMIVSMASNTPVEEVCRAAHEINPETGIWLQIYIQPDRDFTLQLVRRAEACGCTGLVVTVDSPVFGIRERDLRNGFHSLPEGLGCPNMRDDQGQEREIAFDSSLSWSDIAWLQEKTSLPLILKGILHPDDISLAIQHKVQAVIVSNHGGRQLDAVPATIDLLPLLAKVANKRIPLILDGGIRSGADVLKALALGATAVAIGRPIIWGLAINGESGVQQVFECLQRELVSSVRLCGCRTREDINSQLIFPNSNFKG